MSQNFSFTLNPEKLKKLFGGGDDEDDKKDSQRNDDDDEGLDTDIESNVDDSMEKGKTAARRAERLKRIQMVIWRLRCMVADLRLWCNDARGYAKREVQ